MSKISSVADSRHEATASHLFILAMSYHRLGNSTKARDCYDRGVRWLTSQSRLTPFDCDELIALRGEADAILETDSGP
jgi:hypothetical protein